MIMMATVKSANLSGQFMINGNIGILSGMVSCLREGDLLDALDHPLPGGLAIQGRGANPLWGRDLFEPRSWAVAEVIVAMTIHSSVMEGVRIWVSVVVVVMCGETMLS